MFFVGYIVLFEVEERLVFLNLLFLEIVFFVFLSRFVKFFFY